MPVPAGEPRITVTFGVECPAGYDLEKFAAELLGLEVSGPTGERGEIVHASAVADALVPAAFAARHQRVVACRAEFAEDGDIGRYLRRDAIRGISYADPD
ncbi:MAG: hypothetical protein ACJ79H_21725 [Myxococcales bacterium]